MRTVISGVKHNCMHAALPLCAQRQLGYAWDDSNSSVCIDKSPELDRHGAVCRTLVVWWRDPIYTMHAAAKTSRVVWRQWKYQGHLIFSSFYFRSKESVSCTSQILQRLYSSLQLRVLSQMKKLSQDFHFSGRTKGKLPLICKFKSYMLILGVADAFLLANQECKDLVLLALT